MEHIWNNAQEGLLEHVWNNAHEGLLLIMGTGMPKTWQRISEVEGGNMTKQEYHFYDKPYPWFHIPANCPFGHKINVKSLKGKLTRGWTWLRLVDTHLQSMFQPCLGSHKENIATVFMKIMKTFCASKIPLPTISFKKYLELWRCLMHFKSRHRQVWSQVWLLNILKLKSQQRLVASNLQRSLLYNSKLCYFT